MTISEFLNKARELDGSLKNKDGVLYSEAVAKSTEIWSNNACKGYFVIAARAAGLDRETITSVLSELGDAFDFTTLEEAERAYIDF